MKPTTTRKRHDRTSLHIIINIKRYKIIRMQYSCHYIKHLLTPKHIGKTKINNKLLKIQLFNNLSIIQ
jgi:hypothetical protein